MDWTCDFDTNTEFFDRVTTMSPRDLVGFLTENNIEVFSLLRPQNIINGDSYLQHVEYTDNETGGAKWHRRVSPLRAISALVLPILPRRVSLYIAALKILTP